jgi:hypothetical protein
MSRTEELKQKLRTSFLKQAGPLWGDEVWNAFNSGVDAFLISEKSASALSSAFSKALYDRYKSESPPDMAGWIRQKLDGKFLSQRAKPVWPLEPSWYYFEGEPMAFVHQFDDIEGTTFFVFQVGKQITEPHSANVCYYKMIAVSQRKDS